MTDRPIPFSAPMVRALLDGRKTQTRRVLPWLTRSAPEPYWEAVKGSDGVWRVVADTPDLAGELTCGERYDAGDRLYVREAFALVGSCDPGLYVTRADYPACVPQQYENVPPENELRWSPSIHMPRSRSRLTLVVTDVRVQRLQDISEEDAGAEGVQHEEGRYWRDYLMPGTQLTLSARESFSTLWNSINGPDAWAANPWVVAVGFSVICANIDAPSPALSSGDGV